MFFYNSHIDCVCQSDSYNSDSAIPLLTFDSYNDAEQFLFNHNFIKSDKNENLFWKKYERYDLRFNEYSQPDYKIRKFYGLNYYGIVRYQYFYGHDIRDYLCLTDN